MNPYGIVIHGGAGTVSKTKMTKWKVRAYHEVLRHAYNMGYETLKRGGSASEAIVCAITIMEDSPLFNAGKGAVFTNSGTHELDAALMEGKSLRAGAVAGVRLVKNPILLAQLIMKKSKHVLLSGEQALQYAQDNGLEIETPEYFYDEQRYRQWQRALASDEFALDHDSSEDRKFGTVGAVALDRRGNLAAGTSTGGMTNKKHGRIGDSPLIGCGTYADNKSCAISCTGHGEFFMRNVVSHDISARMKYGDETLESAANHLIHKVLKDMGGRGGLIGIDREGNIVMPFNTRGMYRGFKTSNVGEKVAIFSE